MTRRGAALFALMSVVWGVPYLLIKVAVRHLNPAVIVEGRTLIGAAILLPLAVREGRVAPLLRRWRPLALYSVCEMAIPWLLVTSAEQRLPSSLTGLLVASVPLVSLAVAGVADRFDGVRRRADWRTLGGLLVGLAGVALVVGFDVHGAQTGAVVEILLVAVGYAVGPVVATRRLSDQSSLALAAVSVTGVAVIYLPLALLQRPDRWPPATGLVSVVGLGVVCTAVAFVAFFELLREMPPTQATVITYFNPVVAVALGVAVLGEPFRASTGAGFVLILVGSWLSTRRVGAPAVAEP